MSRVIADLIDGEARLSLNGHSVRRLFQVQELSGAASHKLIAAAAASGIPRVGEAHPSLGGVVVTDVRASATGDPSIATVEVTYAVPQSATGTGVRGGIEVSIVSDLYTEETITDVSGQRIETTFFSTGGSGGSFSSTLAVQAHRIEVQRPTFTVQYSRIEAAPPLDLSLAYSGKVNAGAFLKQSADRWLCNIESSQNSANEHRVRYSFTLNRSGWQAQIAHNSAGIIPPTATVNNGIRSAQVYERTNFAALRLPAL